MTKNKAALIGHSGFVGKNILAQTEFSHLYNSQNISEIEGESFNLVVCAAAPGMKWQANKNPEADLAKIEKLISSLRAIKADKFVLISTISVYPDSRGVNEDTSVKIDKASSYGKHRRKLEEFVEENFDDHLIVRLPGIFGRGIKKNFIYDLLHNDQKYLKEIHQESIVQIYDLKHIWFDIEHALKNNLKLLNIATEPVTIEEISSQCFGRDFIGKKDGSIYHDDMQTKHNAIWQQNISYLYPREKGLTDLKSFVETYQD